MIRLIRMEKMKIKDYEFETEKEAWDWFWKELAEFKIKNNVINEETDQSFKIFRVELVHIIWDQLTIHYNDYEKCRTCPEEDHTGVDNFSCRCVARNMRIARQRRKRGQCVWDTSKKLDEKE